MLIAQRPTLAEEVVDDVRSRFVIEPLEPGFGYTLGNSLRRTLLSSIPGAAVTSIRVDGVLHEFTTIPGVKEDVTDLILNLKDLVLRCDSEEPVTLRLDKRGPAVARGHQQPAQGPGPRHPGAPGHRHPRAGTADRRALQQVELVPRPCSRKGQFGG